MSAGAPGRYEVFQNQATELPPPNSLQPHTLPVLGGRKQMRFILNLIVTFKNGLLNNQMTRKSGYLPRVWLKNRRR